MLAVGREHDQSQPASSHEAARWPYHTLQTAPHGNLKCPLKSDIRKRRGPQPCPPGKAGHLSIRVLYARCFHYLTKHSFPSALLLFLPPDYRSYSLESASS